MNKIHEYEMILTIRIIFLVWKINMPLPTIKGHKCGVIPMDEPEIKHFGRFICLLGSRHKRWLSSIPIDVKTP